MKKDPLDLEVSDFYFCINDAKLWETKGHVITFDPIWAWDSTKCLGGWIESDMNTVWNLIQDFYKPLLGSSDIQFLCQDKSKDEIRSHLNSLGFIENIDMEKFLEDIYKDC